MESKEQYELRIKWIDKELERYNNYIKEAVIERFNQLRSILKEEIKDLDLTMACDSFWGTLTFTSKKLNLDRDELDKVIRLSIYSKNLIFRELIDLIEDYKHYLDGLYDFSFQILN